jgi:hypothetical protein
MEMGHHSLRSGLGLHRQYSVPSRTPGRRVRRFKPQAFQLEIAGGIQALYQKRKKALGLLGIQKVLRRMLAAFEPI